MTGEEYTARDKTWTVVIEHLLMAEPIQVADITEAVDVHAKTAQAVLNVAEDAEYLERDSPRAHTWYPLVGPVPDVNDPSEREIRTLIEEAKANREGEDK